MTTLDKAEAAAAIRDGKVIRLTVGTAWDDPVLLVWKDKGSVMCEAIAGWSEGVREPVCALDSDYLSDRFLEGVEKLEIVKRPARLGPAPSPKGAPTYAELMSLVIDAASGNSEYDELSTRAQDLIDQAEPHRCHECGAVVPEIDYHHLLTCLNFDAKEI